MAIVGPRMLVSGWLALMISIVSMISNGHARPRILLSHKVRGLGYKVTGFDKPKGTVKTIESYETGDVIDCVDIFKQPAFDHPLLKNHTMQMKPSSKGKANGEGFVGGAFSQAWWKYGECPEGTVPITRPQKHNHSHVIPLTPNVKRLNLSTNDFDGLPPGRHEYATVSLTHGFFLGARATINVWNPTVTYPEVSFSQIWITSGHGNNMNSLEVGWLVDTISNPRNQARSFVYWTSDGYQHTGCYNLECPGFVHTDGKIALGAPILPVSSYGGQQYGLVIEITKSQVDGHWWLRIGEVDVGYWPTDIFTFLSGHADAISWGGEIVNTQPRGLHTPTQMGSGHFPSEGFGKTSFFRHLKFVDHRFTARDPKNLKKKVTRPKCYDLLLNAEPSSISGVNFYYGGPGLSSQCTK